MALNHHTEMLFTLLVENHNLKIYVSFSNNTYCLKLMIFCVIVLTCLELKNNLLLSSSDFTKIRV